MKTKTKSTNPDAGKTVCGIKCTRNLIAVAEYGQEDRTVGGIFIPEGRSGGLLPGGQDRDQFWRYRFGDWRFGEVISIGPGYIDNRWNERVKQERQQRGLHTNGGVVFHEPPDVRIGQVVMFSRKHGTKVGLRYAHAEYGDLMIRFLDPQKTVAVWDDFEPWWDVQAGQVRPEDQFYG